MAIKVYGDKIVFPDNTEQTTAADSADTSYTKAEIDEQQGKQDVKIDKNATDLTNVYTKAEVNDSQSAQDTVIATKLTDAPDDGETYARNNKTWVGISDSSGIPDAPVDDLMYGRKNGEWDPVADAGDFYTKEEVDAQQKTQDDAIVENNDDIARQQIEISNQQTSIDKNTSDIDTDSSRITTNATNITTNTSNIAKNTADILTNDGNIASNTTKTENNDLAIGAVSEEVATNTSNISTNSSNISSNTTAIGTLSGQVGQNTENIAELQDSIFFSSAYSADYPSAPNRDPEDGNMYLQNLALFTYSYAEATQIFASKTDEAGNIRQFTAIKAGDSIVLNEVESPNYGRYELVSVEDVSDSYVVMNVIPQLGQGTVITGAKVAFQAFPKPGSDSIWTESGNDVYVTNNSNGLYINTAGTNSVNLIGYNGTKFDDIWLRGGNTPDTGLGVMADGSIIASQDMTVNGVNVGKGSGTGENTSLGKLSLSSNSTGNYNVGVGYVALGANETGAGNTGLGFQALSTNVGGNDNTGVGVNSGSTLTSGSNNTLIGNNAQPSASGVSNEVTIGNDAVTVTRLKGNVIVGGGLGVGVNPGDYSLYDSVFKVPNGSGIGITKDNLTDNAYIYFGSGTASADAQQSAIASIGSNLVIKGGGNEAITIGNGGNTTINKALTFSSIGSSSAPGNLVIDGNGTVLKSTTTAYSKQEVEGLVNAKDEIINKLTERLDALEKRVK